MDRKLESHPACLCTLDYKILAKDQLLLPLPQERYELKNVCVAYPCNVQNLEESLASTVAIC